MNNQALTKQQSSEQLQATYFVHQRPVVLNVSFLEEPLETTLMKESSPNFLRNCRTLKDTPAARIAALAMAASSFLSQAGCNNYRQVERSDMTQVSRSLDTDADNLEVESAIESHPAVLINSDDRDVLLSEFDNKRVRSTSTGIDGSFISSNSNIITTFIYDDKQFDIIETKASSPSLSQTRTFYTPPGLFTSWNIWSAAYNQREKIADNKFSIQLKAALCPNEIRAAAAERLKQVVTDRTFQSDDIAFVPPANITLSLQDNLGIEIESLAYSGGQIVFTVTGNESALLSFIKNPRMSVEFEMQGFQIQRNQAEVVLDMVFNEILSKHTDGSAYNMKSAESNIESGTVGGGVPLFCHAASSTQTFKHAQGSVSQVSRDQKLEILKALSARAIGRVSMENGSEEERQELINFVAEQLEKLILIVPGFYDEATEELKIDESIIQDLTSDKITKMKSTAEGKATLKDEVGVEIPKQLKVDAKMESGLEGKSEAEVESESTIPKTIYLALFHQGEFSQHIQAVLQIDRLERSSTSINTNPIFIDGPPRQPKLFKAAPEMVKFNALQGMNESFVVDQDESTVAFHTDRAGPGAWIQWDLGVGNERAFVGIRLQGHTNGGQNIHANWAVQYSDDGIAWTTALDSISMFGDKSRLFVRSAEWDYVGSHRFWRILKTDSAEAGGTHLGVDYVEAYSK